MNSFYLVSFGPDHCDKLYQRWGVHLTSADTVAIDARDEDEARGIAFDHFGISWSSIEELVHKAIRQEVPPVSVKGIIFDGDLHFHPGVYA